MQISQRTNLNSWIAETPASLHVFSADCDDSTAINGEKLSRINFLTSVYEYILTALPYGFLQYKRKYNQKNKKRKEKSDLM